MIRHVWRLDAAWMKIGVVAAVLGVLIPVLFHIVDSPAEPAAAVATAVVSGVVSAPASFLTGSRDQQCSLRLPTPPTTENDFAVCMLVRGADGEQKRDTATYPFGLATINAEYRNTGAFQQDEVTFRASVPHGFSLVPRTSVYFNSLRPEGIRASDNVSSVGVNLGSYAPGANVSLLFDVQAAEPATFHCGENRGIVTFRVTVAGRAKATESTLAVIRTCPR
jgi:hypothetical protein